MHRIISTALLFLAAFCLGNTVAFAQPATCDETCMTDIARDYMNEVYRDNPSIQAAREFANDVVIRDFSRLPWGEPVRFTENNVAMMIGEGFWGAARGDMQELLVLADETSGNVLWFGIVEEHEQAAYHGMRLKIDGNRISEVETYFGREGTPDWFESTEDYVLDARFTQVLPENQRRSRERMVIIANGYLASRQGNDGRVYVNFTDDCSLVVNGVDISRDNYWGEGFAQGCQAQLEEGLYRPVDRIRGRRFPIVDEETGVVVALSLEDHAAHFVEYESVSGTPQKIKVEYPNTRGKLEALKIVDGAIARIEGVSVFLPYYMQDLWQQ